MIGCYPIRGVLFRVSRAWLPMPLTALKEGGGTDGKVLVKWDVTPDVLPDSCHRGQHG